MNETAGTLTGLTAVGETSRGDILYRQPNGAGGHRYWSDSIGGGVVIYDTCLSSVEELELALKIEKEFQTRMDNGEDRPSLVPTSPVIAARPSEEEIRWLCENPRCSLAMVEIEGAHVPMLLNEHGEGPMVLDDGKAVPVPPPTRLWPKHPGAICPGRTGAFSLNSGDRFTHDLDGQTGWADEFTSDGDALVCWDDGTYDTIKWNHMSPEPQP